jgi:uncharacterized protein YecE (DUF72 family)
MEKYPMAIVTRATTTVTFNDHEKRINALQRQLKPYLVQFSPEMGILWQQAARFQRQRRYRAAEVTLQQLQEKLYRF